MSACKCGQKNCRGYLLIHPNEMKDLQDMKDKELEKNPKAKFELLDSQSSGEVFTKFKELHIRAY